MAQYDFTPTHNAKGAYANTKTARNNAETQIKKEGKKKINDGITSAVKAGKYKTTIQKVPKDIIEELYDQGPFFDDETARYVPYNIIRIGASQFYYMGSTKTRDTDSTNDKIGKHGQDYCVIGTTTIDGKIFQTLEVVTKIKNNKTTYVEGIELKDNSCDLILAGDKTSIQAIHENVDTDQEGNTGTAK